MNSNLSASTQIPSHIELIIKGSQYKDLLKQYVILVKNNKKGLLNPKDIKQNVRGEISWKLDKATKDLVTFRLTGDYFNDHFNLKRNYCLFVCSTRKMNILTL